MIILNTININHKNLKLLLKGHFLGGGGGELHQQPKESTKKKKLKWVAWSTGTQHTADVSASAGHMLANHATQLFLLTVWPKDVF